MAKPHIETCDELNPAEGKLVRDRYESGRGMYVIILNSCFRYMKDSKNSCCLDYSGEKRKWESLLERSGHTVYYGENLEPYPEDGERQLKPGEEENPDLYFDDFIDVIKKKIKAEKPKFVFFYIASHGDDDGNFYLSSRGRAKKSCNTECMDRTVRQKATECSAHCTKENVEANSPNLSHVNTSLKDLTEPGGSRLCHRRKMDVLIQDIQNLGIAKGSFKQSDGSFNLVGKPKIFVESFCRGVSEEPGVIPTDALWLDASVIKQPVTLALHSDTIRLHATVLNKKSYLQGCSWLLNQLYLEAMKFKTAPAGSLSGVQPFTADQIKAATRKASKTNQWIKKSGHAGSISQVYAEDLLDGWFPDLCRRVCCHVGLKDVVATYWEPHTREWLKLAQEYRDKQQPEFTSTLHRKLSCFDLFG